MTNSILVEEPLMSVKIEKTPEGIYITKFIVNGGTVNEFTFGTDEDEAKAKTAMLTDGIIQGLEFVQDTVRDQYSEGEEPTKE